MDRPTNPETARHMSVELLIRVLAAKPDLLPQYADAEDAAEHLTKAAKKLGAFIWPDYFKG